MRHHRISVTAVALAAVVAGSIAAAAPSQAGLVTSCTGTASDVTVPGDLFVPAGESCDLTNVTINGNTTVRDKANLFLTGSTLNGSLTLQTDGFVDAEHTTVTGATQLSTAFGAFVQDSTLTGDVTTDGPSFLYSLRSTHKGGIASTNGETYLESGRVAGDIRTSGDLLTDLNDTVVQGTFAADTATLGSVLCASEVDGAASFSNGGTLELGGTTPVSACAFDVFADSVTATGNADVHVVGTVIRGSLNCTGNATVDGSGNRLRGGATGQCASLAPAAASKAAAVTGARKNAIVTKIGSRTNTGERAASKAGLAHIGH